MTTPEEETEARLAARHEHLQLRQQLGVARDYLWFARDAARTSYEAAIADYLADPSDDLLEPLIAAAGRLLAHAHVLADLTDRRDKNRSVAVD